MAGDSIDLQINTKCIPLTYEQRNVWAGDLIEFLRGETPHPPHGVFVGKIEPLVIDNDPVAMCRAPHHTLSYIIGGMRDDASPLIEWNDSQVVMASSAIKCLSGSIKHWSNQLVEMAGLQDEFPIIESE